MTQWVYICITKHSKHNQPFENKKRKKDTKQHLDPLGSAQPTSGIRGASEHGRDSFCEESVSKFCGRERLKICLSVFANCAVQCFQSWYWNKEFRPNKCGVPVGVFTSERAKGMLVPFVIIMQKQSIRILVKISWWWPIAYRWLKRAHASASPKRSKWGIGSSDRLRCLL